MKCKNCNAELLENANFCGKCGSKIINEKSSKKKHKKLFIILGIILAIIILIVVIIKICTKNNVFDDPFEDYESLATLNGYKTTNEYEIEEYYVIDKIEEDYNNHILSNDEYIMQLAYSLYDYEKLDSKYKGVSNKYNEPKKLLEKIVSIENKLSKETIEYAIKKITLSDIVWDVQDENPSKTNNNVDGKVVPLKEKFGKVNKLDKVKISSGNHFLVYYTNDGNNAVTDERAEKIATYLESVITMYKEKFGLDYKFELDKKIFNSKKEKKCPSKLTSVGKACALLEKNNIDIQYLETAMPVYIVDTDSKNSGLLGYYVPILDDFSLGLSRVSAVLFGDDIGASTYSAVTTYSFPFFAVNSKITEENNFEITLAHELFHHYQKYICGNGKYDLCKSTNFTTETTANYAASSVVEPDPALIKIGTGLNWHSTYTTTYADTSLDILGINYKKEAVGYGQYVFAHQYAQIVPNGTKYLFESMKTIDTLKYLYDNSNGKYKDVMIRYAEKLLTQDYENKYLISLDEGTIYYPRNYAEIYTVDDIQEYSINYSSMNYFYVKPLNYDENTQITFSGPSNNLTLILFVKENNAYKPVYTHSLENEFVININEFGYYEEVAFGIVNSDITNNIKYKVEVKTNGTKKPTVTVESLGLKRVTDADMITCYTNEENSVYRIFNQFKVTFDRKEQINSMHMKLTLKLLNGDKDDISFKIAKKLSTGAAYLEKYIVYYDSDIKIMKKEDSENYSLVLKYNRNYKKLLGKEYKDTETEKYYAIKLLLEEGYKCKFVKKG